MTDGQKAKIAQHIVKLLVLEKLVTVEVEAKVPDYEILKHQIEESFI